MIGDSAAINAIAATGITKHFDGVIAVANVHISIASNEIVALTGGNGSGKTTLLRIIAGALSPDAGSVMFNRARLEPGKVAHARALGIEMVFQDCSLCPDANVVENIFLGNEIKSALGFLKKRSMKRVAMDLIEKYDLPIRNLDAKPCRMSGGERKAVAIARALASKPTFLLLDEPTTALGVKEQGTVLAIVKCLRANGVGICICTHSPSEVLEVATRIAVLHRGELVLDAPTAAMSRGELALAMSN